MHSYKSNRCIVAKTLRTYCQVSSLSLQILMKETSVLTPGFESIPYNDIDSLKKIIEEKGDRIAGFMVEPIQGEAGVFVPDNDFIKKAAALSNENNILHLSRMKSDRYCKNR